MTKCKFVNLFKIPGLGPKCRDGCSGDKEVRPEHQLRTPFWIGIVHLGHSPRGEDTHIGNAHGYPEVSRTKNNIDSCLSLLSDV